MVDNVVLVAVSLDQRTSRKLVSIIAGSAEHQIRIEHLVNETTDERHGWLVGEGWMDVFLFYFPCVTFLLRLGITFLWTENKD